MQFSIKFSTLAVAAALAARAVNAGPAAVSYLFLISCCLSHTAQYCFSKNTRFQPISSPMSSLITGSTRPTPTSPLSAPLAKNSPSASQPPLPTATSAPTMSAAVLATYTLADRRASMPQARRAFRRRGMSDSATGRGVDTVVTSFRPVGRNWTMAFVPRLGHSLLTSGTESFMDLTL